MSANKSFTFADGYGLGLIAKDPRGDWSEIVTHLSDDAQKIANAIINPVNASRDAKTAAKELLDMADKIQKNDVR